MSKWQLRFEPVRVHRLIQEYEQNPKRRKEDLDVVETGLRARQAGQYSRDDFLAVCEWKTPRSKRLCEKNAPEEVAEISRIALSTSIERLRVEVLRCLHGVGWPTASVLLHLAHREPYPILDVRALWSWGFDKAPAYTFEFWWEYVQRCRRLAGKLKVDMRTLDRALWLYSKNHQGKLA